MPPENRLTDCDDWFRRRPGPLAMTGFLVAYLQAHFSDPRSVDQIRMYGGESEPNAIVTAPHTDEPSSYVTVESITRWRPDRTDIRPAVVVQRGEWTKQRIGIADKLMMGAVQKDGAVTYCKLLSGSHTLFCVHRGGATAEMLAAEVDREMDEFAQTIRETLNLKTFGVAGTGKLFKLEEPKEHYAVPVTVAYVCEHTWRVVPQAPKLKTIRFTYTLP